MQELVLDDKWGATISARVAAELNTLTLTLVDRIRELGNRYDQTVGELESHLAELDARVAKHLAEMGVS